MKKLLLLALLCLSFVASKSQNVTNKTQCAITVCAICYDPVQCVIFNVCPQTMSCVTVFPGATLPLPTCPQCQVPPNLIAYTVCWANPACPPPGNCVTVAPPPSSCFPPLAVLPACSPCPPANVVFSTTGDLLIQ